jgi:hypothetical protein
MNQFTMLPAGNENAPNSFIAEHEIVTEIALAVKSGMKMS